MTITPLFSHGAVLGTGPDASVPWHYGELLREQRRLALGKAFVDLGQYELLTVTGPDTLTWLTTITSQDFSDFTPGASAEMTVLSPQGRVEHWAQAVGISHDSATGDCGPAGATGVLLILDHGARAGLRRYLEMMTFANRITLTDRNDWRALGATRPLAELLPGVPLVAQFDQAWPEVAPGGVAYSEDADTAEPWFIGIAAEQDLRDAIASGSLTRSAVAGMSGAEALRVLSHRPRFATEVDERTIPHELDLLRTAVHTQKGCYRGQETVAKVLNLGQPPRRLVLLQLDGSQDLIVPAGAEVKLGSKSVGTVTTSVMHVDEGPVALAVIRRAVPLDAPLQVRFEIGEDELFVDAAQEPIVREREHGQRPQTANLGRR